MDLKGKVILITGASRGIGAATAILAAKEGAKVVVNYNRSKKEAEKVVGSIEISGGDAVAIQADVARREDEQKMVNGVIKKWGRVDVLINNAGVLAWGNLTENKPEQIDWQLDTNLRGLIHLTHLVLSLMRKQKAGIIINISSGAGKTGYPGLAVYSATKFAVLGFTQSLAHEAQRDNIRVYAVCPGMTATDMTGGTGMSPEKVAQRIIACAKEELDLQPGEDTEIYS